MKGLKRTVAIAITMLSVCVLFAFVGCGKEEGSSLSGIMKIVLAPDAASATVIDVDLAGFSETDSVMDVIDSLTEAERLCYKGSKGVYGVYLTALGVPEENTAAGQTGKADKYILEEDTVAKRSLYVYTNVDADKLETEEGSSYVPLTVEYEGQTLTESVNSVSNMSIRDGAIVYFTYLIWG